MKMTRLFPVLALLLAAYSCQSGDAAMGTGSKAERPGGDRFYRFTYAVTVPAPPAGTDHLDIWVPLPMDDPGVQEISNLVIHAPTGYEVTTEPTHGNKMIHYRLGSPSGPTSISWTATVLRHEDIGQGTKGTAPVHLAANRLVPIDGAAKAMATKLGTRDAKHPVGARAKSIYDDVLAAMEYDKQVPGFGFGDFGRSITVCKGNCTDFHARFTGVGRASGIPIRFTMGIPMEPVASGTHDSYHCWAHWHDGTNWQPVDISEADKVVDTDPDKAERFFGNLDSDRLALTSGRDIVLAPAQNGPPLNYFIFPYAEADGRRFAALDDKSNWTFTYEDIPTEDSADPE